jgi:hypothetical protein
MISPKMVINSLNRPMIIFWATLCNGRASDDNSSAECDGILTQVDVTGDQIRNMQWIPAFAAKARRLLRQ